MSKLFTPQRADGKAEWRVAYELLLPLPIGGVITYDELCEALDRPRWGDMRPIYRVVQRATQELRRHHQRSTEAVNGVGYRVLHPSEHELQARRFHRSSRKRLATSLEVVKATDMALLNEIQRSRTVSLALVIQGMCAQIDHLDRRQRQTEAIVARIENETSERLSAAEEQMSRIANAMRDAGLLHD
jgi:hypothetical protein